MLVQFRSALASCISRPLYLFLLLAVVFFGMLPSVSRAQAVSTGTVGGLVTDPSGSAIVGAAITLTDKATNSPRTEATNDVGRYFFPSVPPGDYEISVNKSGFRVTKSTIKVNIGLALTLDLKLELGSVSEMVEVVATGAELQTANATMGTTLSGETLLLL